MSSKKKAKKNTWHVWTDASFSRGAGHIGGMGVVIKHGTKTVVEAGWPFEAPRFASGPSAQAEYCALAWGVSQLPGEARRRDVEVICHLDCTEVASHVTGTAATADGGKPDHVRLALAALAACKPAKVKVCKVPRKSVDRADRLSRMAMWTGCPVGNWTAAFSEDPLLENSELPSWKVSIWTQRKHTEGTPAIAGWVLTASDRIVACGTVPLHDSGDIHSKFDVQVRTALAGAEAAARHPAAALARAMHERLVLAVVGKQLAETLSEGLGDGGQPPSGFAAGKLRDLSAETGLAFGVKGVSWDAGRIPFARELAQEELSGQGMRERELSVPLDLLEAAVSHGCSFEELPDLLLHMLAQSERECAIALMTPQKPWLVCGREGGPMTPARAFGIEARADDKAAGEAHGEEGGEAEHVTDGMIAAVMDDETPDAACQSGTRPTRPRDPDTNADVTENAEPAELPAPANPEAPASEGDAAAVTEAGLETLLDLLDDMRGAIDEEIDATRAALAVRIRECARDATAWADSDAEKLRVENSELAEKLQAAEHKIAELEEDNAGLVDTADELQGKLDAVAAELDSARKENERLFVQRARLLRAAGTAGTGTDAP